MPIAESRNLTIHISEHSDEEQSYIPYTKSPLDTFRGGKGFQLKRKKKERTGDDKKDKKTEKMYSNA